MNTLLRTILIFCLVQSPCSFAQSSRAAVSKPEPNSSESGSDEEDESDGGDPFARYERSKLRDQNCDPTILESFYKKFGRLSCLVTNAGICINPGKDELTWALWGAGGGAVGNVGRAYAARSAARLRVADFKAADQAMRAMAEALSSLGGGQAAKEALMSARPLLLSSTEREAAKTVGGMILRNGSRGAILGFLSGGALAVILVAADITLTHGITPLACAEAADQDPNFRKYVPVQKGTCHTPDYNAGAPQVREFLKLPFEEKLRVLNENPRVCGFYRSMNEEMDVRIAQLEGSRAVGRVTCDASTGDITFRARNDTNRTMIIKRKPGSKTPTAYQFREYAAPNLAIDGADFNLVQTENGLDLTSIQSLPHGVSTVSRRIAYEEFGRYANENPPRAQTLLHAFRTVRTHAKNLMECCDMSAEDLAKKENHEKCPPSWFPPRPAMQNVPLPPERPKSLR